MKQAKWRNFTRQEIEQFVKESYSLAALASKLGYDAESGGCKETIKAMIEELNLDISHFTGQASNKNNFDYSRFKNGSVIKASTAINALSFLRGHCCENCNEELWLGQPIPLEVHHIDGNSLNNELTNLKLLCPNCHALTDNYRGRNVNKKTQTIISDDDFAEVLKDSANIRQGLRKLGLTPKGGNYTRAREIIHKYNIVHLL